jgi:hypothetical protein
VVTVLGRRRARAAQSATPSPSTDELAVYAAEAIVGRAWADQLLRYFDRMDGAFHAARLQCEAAAGCLVVAQRCGDPGEISLAHAALERALDACRASEAAREQGRQALQAALEALVRMDGERAGSAQAAGPADGDPLSGRRARPRVPALDPPRAARRRRRPGPCGACSGGSGASGCAVATQGSRDGSSAGSSGEPGARPRQARAARAAGCAGTVAL